jgi:hypothetical protein
MTSPRGIRSLWKHTFVVAGLLAGFGGSPLHAQDTTPPSNPPSGNPSSSTNVDTAGRPADTTAVGGAAPDTGQQPAAGQTGARPDSLAPDSLRRDTSGAASAPPGVAPTAPAAPPPAPVDSVLAAACRQSGGEPPDLLTVVFRPTATAAERQKAARDVGGTLLEPSRYQVPGAWYVQVPGSGINPLIADRLILMPPVLEVGATRCPS